MELPVICFRIPCLPHVYPSGLRICRPTRCSPVRCFSAIGKHQPAHFTRGQPRPMRPEWAGFSTVITASVVHISLASQTKTLVKITRFPCRPWHQSRTVLKISFLALTGGVNTRRSPLYSRLHGQQCHSVLKSRSKIFRNRLLHAFHRQHHHAIRGQTPV